MRKSSISNSPMKNYNQNHIHFKTKNSKPSTKEPKVGISKGIMICIIYCIIKKKEKGEKKKIKKKKKKKSTLIKLVLFQPLVFY